jgi:hypothetical protein
MSPAIMPVATAAHLIMEISSVQAGIRSELPDFSPKLPSVVLCNEEAALLSRRLSKPPDSRGGKA